MPCDRCKGKGEIEVVEDYFDYCDCYKGVIRKYGDYKEKQLRLKRDLKSVNAEIKLIKEKLDS